MVLWQRTDVNGQANTTDIREQGVHEVSTNVSIRILETNFSKRPVVRHKYTCIAIGTGTPECVVAPERNDGLKQTNEVNESHYKDLENLRRQIECRIKVKNEDGQRKEHGYRKEVKIDAKFDTNCVKFIDLMTGSLKPHKRHWKSHWVTFKGSSTRTLRPYGAGSRVIQFKKVEIDEMLKKKAMKPAVTEWAPRLVSVPKKDGLLLLCYDYRI